MKSKTKKPFNWRKDVVMQAEGSDGVKGEAVASEGQAEANKCAGCGSKVETGKTCYVCIAMSLDTNSA